MSDEICGEEKGDGEQCTYTPKYPDGKCGFHTEEDEPVEEESNPVGRPTKLSYERQEQIASDIEQGKSINSAARKAGVTPNTVFNWLDRGESEKEAGNENEYVEFFNRITRAKGQGEDFYFSLALQLAKENEDHRFIASLMKQRYPDSWAESEDSPGVNDSAGTVINIPESVTEKWQRQ